MTDEERASYLVLQEDIGKGTACWQELWRIKDDWDPMIEAQKHAAYSKRSVRVVEVTIVEKTLATIVVSYVITAYTGEPPAEGSDR